MKRLWIGISFLVLLLAGGITLSLGMVSLHNRISSQLSAASRSAQAQDWEAALQLSDAAGKDWDKYRHITAAFTDHEPIEQMDSLFSQLDTFRAFALSAEYAATCQHLADLSGAIAESHSLTWWNLL